MESWKTKKITTNKGVVKSILKLNKEEIIDLYIKCASDPIYTIETFFEVFDGRVDSIVPFILFPFQKMIIRSYLNNRLNLTNKYRQAGISTITCAYLAWYIAFRKNRKVAIVADKLETARDELMKDVIDFIDMLPPFLHPKISTPDKATHKGFSNSSEVKAFATKRFRGMTPTFMFWDETAHAEKGDEFWTAVWPSLATGGHCAFVSCVTKDTFVWTNNGLQQFEDFIDLKEKSSYFVDEYEVVGKDKKRNGSILFNNGVHRTKKVQSKYATIEGTINHKIFTYNSGSGNIGYDELFKVKKNDLIALQYGLKFSGDNDTVSDVSATLTNKKFYDIKLNENLIKLISYYILKGKKSFNTRPEIKIENINEKEFNELKTTLINDLDVAEKFVKYENNSFISNSIKLNNFLNKLQIGNFFKIKKLSKPILSFKYDLLFSLLKNIYLINGSIDIAHNSKIFLKQIQQLLLNAGYLSELKDNSLYIGDLSFNNQFMLSISNIDLDNFILNKKVIYDFTLPIGFTNYLNKSLADNYKLKFKYYKYSELREIINSNSVYTFINEYLNDNMYYDVVKNISKSNANTYDFSLPNNDEDKYCHSVIYNGIIGHQTPNGLDPVFYKTYAAAKNGDSKFNINEIYWYEDPRYNVDLKWVRRVLTNNPDDPEETFEETIEDNNLENFPKYIKEGYEPTSTWFIDMSMEYQFDKHKINQELKGDFLGSGNNFIDNADIQYYEKRHQCDPIRKEYDENTWIWEEPVKDAKYIMNIDVSSGTSEDYSTIEILKIEDNLLEQVLEFKGKISPDILGEFAYRYGIRYNMAYAVVDITGGIGVTTIQKLIDMGYTNIHYSLLRNEKIKERLISYAKIIDEKTYLPGFTFGTNRGMILIEMKRVIEMREIIIKSSRLLSEFKTFITHQTRVADHRRSFHDDLIMAIGMGIYVISYEIRSTVNDKEKLQQMLEIMKKLNNIDQESGTNYFKPLNPTNEFINTNVHNWLFKNLNGK
jgi:hypothetical protein